MNKRNRATSHWFRFLACPFFLALGLWTAAEAQSLVKPLRVETAPEDVPTDINADVGLVGSFMDGVGVRSEGEGVAVYGRIRQFGKMFPMSAGTLSLYGGFLIPELIDNWRDNVIAASMKGLDAERNAPILDFALAPATPNPSSGSVRFAWAVPRPSQVRIAILDVQGRQVTVLADGEHAPGRYEAVWNASGTGRQNVPGIYFVRMQTPERAFVRRVVVIP